MIAHLWRVNAQTLATSQADPRLFVPFAATGGRLYAEELASHELVAVDSGGVDPLGAHQVANPATRRNDGLPSSPPPTPARTSGAATAPRRGPKSFSTSSPAGCPPAASPGFLPAPAARLDHRLRRQALLPGRRGSRSRLRRRALGAAEPGRSAPLRHPARHLCRPARADPDGRRPGRLSGADHGLRPDPSLRQRRHGSRHLHLHEPRQLPGAGRYRRDRRPPGRGQPLSPQPAGLRRDRRRKPTVSSTWKTSPS